MITVISPWSGWAVVDGGIGLGPPPASPSTGLWRGDEVQRPRGVSGCGDAWEAAVAQPVERGAVDPEVPGSNPGGGPTPPPAGTPLQSEERGGAPGDGSARGPER